jgi:phosphatidate cytidylyltransferase
MRAIVAMAGSSNAAALDMMLRAVTVTPVSYPNNLRNMPSSGLSAEIVARLVSALCLAVVAVVALLSGLAPFTALVGALGIAMGWEWGRAVRRTPVDATHIIHGLSLAAVCVAAYFGQYAAAAAAIAVGASAVWLSCRRAEALMSAIGVVYVGVPAIALIWLRQDETYGITAVLFLFCVVWTHDTFAMLVGKLIGGPRLWPLLSPNKTWAGVAGGLTASAIAGITFAALLGSTDTLLSAVMGFLLGLAALVGDLIESAFKRTYRLKNASGLIPGHGGVLDRLDGAVFAANVAAIVALLVAPDAPARAILFWA